MGRKTNIAMKCRSIQLRVIDESGEDYLYPKSYFATIELPTPVRKAVLAAV